MKPGAGDDPFADDAGIDEPEEDEADRPDAADDRRAEAVGATTDAAGPAAAGPDSGSPSGTDEPANGSGSRRGTAPETEPAPEHERELGSLPYKYRRESVKQGRNQQPMFLQSSTRELIAETVDDAEERFDEEVYKTDVVEAMLVAGAEGTTPQAVLRRWGYGMKNG